MKAVVQRVKSASVDVEGERVGAIDAGLLVLLGVEQGDTEDDARFLADKVARLRIFEDDAGKMNLSVLDIAGEVLAVSQFTLCANCSKGRRPSFDPAAGPELAQPLYEEFVEALKREELTVATGRFGVYMAVSLVNDGPVTFILESPNK